MTNSPRNSSGTWIVDDEGRYCIKGHQPHRQRRLPAPVQDRPGYAMKTGGGEMVPVEKLELAPA